MVKSRKQSRKQQRRTRKGRRSCKAVYTNRQSFGQRGGMAAIVPGDALLIDSGMREAAGVAGTFGAFAELPKGQMGGRRRKQSGRKQSGRKQRSRRQKKSQRKQRSRRRQQRGGMAPFGWTGMTKLEGVNPEFDQQGVVTTY